MTEKTVFILQWSMKDQNSTDSELNQGTDSDGPSAFST